MARLFDNPNFGYGSASSGRWAIDDAAFFDID
jgi:hypothetical protein